MNNLLRIFFLMLSIFALNCNAQSSAKTESCKKLSFAEAEKILGQKVKLVTNSWDSADGKTIFKCQYQAIEKDKTSGNDINLFFMIEQSSSENQAKEIYKAIWESNKNHAGIEVLDGIGDEAYAHSDKGSFHFFLVRKGNSTIRMKVNKAVETTSFEEVKAFAKRVSKQI